MSSIYKSDELFLTAKQFSKEGKHDEAADCYSQLLKKIGESGEDADMSPDCAPIWFAYGDALLRQEEENPTDDLLGTAASEAKKAAASLASELSGPGDDDDDDDDDGDDDAAEAAGAVGEHPNNVSMQQEGQEQAGGDDEDGSDMQIAWECLETCRRICEAGPMSSSADDEDNGELDDLLAETHLRLGDLLRFNGQFNDAIAEYHNSLRLKTTLSKDEEVDRDLSSTYFMIASAHIYNASEIAQQENEVASGASSAAVAAASSSSSSSSTAGAGKSGAINEKKKALYNYQMCHKILQNILDRKAAPSGTAVKKDDVAVPMDADTKENTDNMASASPVTISAAERDLEDVAEMRDELVETIDALRTEIKSCELESITGPPAGITTTIGFGQATSSSSSSAANPTGALNFGGNVAPRPPVQGGANVFSFGTANASAIPAATNAFGFGSATSGFTPATADTSGGAVSVMQVKKKVKLNQ